MSHWMTARAVWRRWEFCLLPGSLTGMLCTDETCQKQIEKDVPRPGPISRQRNPILGMAGWGDWGLLGLNRFTRGSWRFGHSSEFLQAFSHGCGVAA